MPLRAQTSMGTPRGGSPMASHTVNLSCVPLYLDLKPSTTVIIFVRTEEVASKRKTTKTDTRMSPLVKIKSRKSAGAALVTSLTPQASYLSPQ
jgi:hypothetical protein